ncbi:MAG: Fic family protein, partial [bacterium]|nr:Fic family protein [bacterium]
MKPLTIAEVEYIAHSLAKELMTWDEPIPDFGTRFPNVLESCLLTPFQRFGGKSAYSSFLKKASMLFYLMIKNHPFQNGNKR